jgi:hypothetical protein
MTVTLVSMFFHLNQARPKEFYYTHGRAVLTIDAPMVLFCDADTRPGLEAIRGDRPTVYVEKPLADYDYYATLLPLVTANRKVRPSPDPRNTAEYFLVSVFKFYALYFAAQRCPSSHYMWIDLGCSHVVRGIPDAVLPILQAPRPKVACCSIRYRSRRELYPLSSYFAAEGKCGIAAGIFTVEASYVSRLFALTNSVLYEQIAEGVGHAEEQILVYCYDRHPEWFSLYCGDYYSLATNYHRPVEDLACIQAHFVEPAVADGRHDLARLPRLRLLVLVLSSDTHPIYASLRDVWRSHMNKTPGVDIYFLERGETQSHGDTLVSSGPETWAGLTDKTLAAFNQLPLHAYTYVLRTNLSSAWNFPKLLDLIDPFPRRSLYAGVQGEYFGIPYVSGAGILMSSDVCSFLLEHEAEVRSVGIMDDVDIGAVLAAHGCPIGASLPRIDIHAPTDPIPLGEIHYRIKFQGLPRDREPEIMRAVLR